MHLQSSLALVAGCVAAVSAVPQASYQPSGNVPAKYEKGFLSPTVSESVGGKAYCVQGIVPVAATSTKNVKLKYAIPANQTVVTETFVEMFEIDSPLASMVTGPMTTVSGTYNISSMLCYPKKGLNSTTIQILTHGVGFAKSYWNFASEQFSYIDAAADAGYATFAYDRLGTGESAHPDPIQVVQAPMEVIILNNLITGLRSGRFASTSFSHVVGVGHSFGSILTEAITANYPKALDAAVLTGFSTSTTGQATFLAALDLTIASIIDPEKFGSLNNGYLVAANRVGNQFAFLRAQGFPFENLVLGNDQKSTVTPGELFTLSSVLAPATNFTGPIDVVNGANDFAFCQGNCRVPTNQAAAVKGMLYPAASAGSEYYLAYNAGHGLNLHYSAAQAYAQIMKFVKTNGL